MAISVQRVCLFIFFFATLGLYTPHVMAAGFGLEIERAGVPPGDELVVHATLDTFGESLNAFEGIIRFPPNMASLKEIRDAGSIITIWLTRPAIQEEGTIVFSGIAPGGYAGDQGLVLTLVFEAREEGIGVLSLSKVRALRNDGQGTDAASSGMSAQFAVSRSARRIQEERVDTEAPEPFTIVIDRDTSAFEGKAFLSFAAQDKGRGIARYEVCEGLFGSCNVATSPYALSSTDVPSLVTVRAIDNAGNVRVARLFTLYAFVHYAVYGMLGILVLVGASLAFLRWKRVFS